MPHILSIHFVNYLFLPLGYKLHYGGYFCQFYSLVDPMFVVWMWLNALVSLSRSVRMLNIDKTKARIQYILREVALNLIVT